MGQEILSERSQGSGRNGWGSASRGVVTALHHVLEDHRLLEKHRGVADESDSISRLSEGLRCGWGRELGIMVIVNDSRSRI